MTGQAPKQIKIDASQNKKAQEYYSEVFERLETLNQNIAPYDETISKAEDSVALVDKELDNLYSRVEALQEQRNELEGIIEDAYSTRDMIMSKHCEGLDEVNTSFFKQLSKSFNLPELLDTKSSWDVDLQYMGTFNIMFITQILPETSESITDSEDVSKWIDDINNDIGE